MKSPYPPPFALAERPDATTFTIVRGSPYDIADWIQAAASLRPTMFRGAAAVVLLSNGAPRWRRVALAIFADHIRIFGAPAACEHIHAVLQMLVEQPQGVS